MEVTTLFMDQQFELMSNNITGLDIKTTESQDHTVELDIHINVLKDRVCEILTMLLPQPHDSQYNKSNSDVAEQFITHKWGIQHADPLCHNLGNNPILK